MAYVRAECRVAGAPQDYRGPMAKPHRMLLVTLACLFFALCPGEWRAPFWGPGREWGAAQLVLVMIVVGGVVTAARRLRGAARYLGRNGHA